MVISPYQFGCETGFSSTDELASWVKRMKGSKIDNRWFCCDTPWLFLREKCRLRVDVMEPQVSLRTPHTVMTT